MFHKQPHKDTSCPPGQTLGDYIKEVLEQETTGWPPGMLQDDCKELSKALSNKPDSKKNADEAVQKIIDERTSP